MSDTPPPADRPWPPPGPDVAWWGGDTMPTGMPVIPVADEEPAAPAGHEATDEPVPPLRQESPRPISPAHEAAETTSDTAEPAVAPGAVARLTAPPIAAALSMMAAPPVAAESTAAAAPPVVTVRPTAALAEGASGTTATQTREAPSRATTHHVLGGWEKLNREPSATQAPETAEPAAPKATPTTAPARQAETDPFPLWPAESKAAVSRPVDHDAHDEPANRDAAPGSATKAPPAWQPARDPRSPAVGLAALLPLALIAAFLAWTSAEPLWIALGHAERGVITVQRCEGSGLLHRCVVSFTGPSYQADEVALGGMRPPEGAALGARVDARMVPGGRAAYVATDRALHIRWGIGLSLLLLCGLTIAWATGAGRLPRRAGRAGAILLSLAGPLLLLAGMMAVTY